MTVILKDHKNDDNKIKESTTIIVNSYLGCKMFQVLCLKCENTLTEDIRLFLFLYKTFGRFTESLNSGHNCVGSLPDSVTNLGHLRTLTYLLSPSASLSV